MMADPEVMRYLPQGEPLPGPEAWRSMAAVLGHWQLAWFRSLGSRGAIQWRTRWMPRPFLSRGLAGPGTHLGNPPAILGARLCYPGRAGRPGRGMPRHSESRGTRQ